MGAEVLLTGIVLSVVCVLLPGWGLKQVLQSQGMKFGSDHVSSTLSSFALGVHVNAITFILCWTLVNPDHPVRLAATIIAADVALGLLGVWFSRRIPQIRPPVLWAVAVGLVLGSFAAIRFPSTLDSVQILQVQTYLLGSGGGHLVAPDLIAKFRALLFGGIDIPIQSGFAGIALVPSLVHWGLPVATVAAANKVLLLCLAAVISLYAARKFHPGFGLIGATLILANLILSQFGLYGLLTTGKDSAFSIVMALASIAALNGSEEASNEPGLYMSAAVLLGAVTVPYLMLFWALYFLFSGGAALRMAARQAVWCVWPLALAVVGVRTAFAAPGTPTIGLFPVLLASLVATVVLVIVAKNFGKRRLLFGQNVGFAFACIPAFCIVGIVLLMPMTGHIIIGQDNGALITASYSPLDGKTSAVDFLLGLYPTNNPWMAVGAILSLMLTPIVSARFRTPFYLAFFSFIPVTAFLAFAHIKLGLHILPDFNLWDISRNTVQWWVGALAAVFVILGLSSALDWLPRMRAGAVPAAMFVFVVGFAQHYPLHAWILSQRPTITASGGFDHGPTAVAMDFIWREARNNPVYVSQDSTFETNFYSYQMYGANPVEHFDASVIGREPVQAYLANAGDLSTILRLAEKRRDSGFVRTVSDDAYMVQLQDDGSAMLDVQGVPKLVIDATGVFDVESSESVTFRWATQDVLVHAIQTVGTGDKFCPTLKFVNTWADPDLEIEVTSDNQKRILPVPQTANFINPASANICAGFDENGSASLIIHANKSARQFPGDSRDISFGLIWPVD